MNYKNADVRKVAANVAVYFTTSVLFFKHIARNSLIESYFCVENKQRPYLQITRDNFFRRRHYTMIIKIHF